MKKVRRIFAGAMVLAMAFSYSVAGAGQPPAPTAVTGTTAITNPVYSVLLPTAASMAVQLNPMSVGSTDKDALKPQVSSGSAIIANRSSVPVEVTAVFGARLATTGTTATLVTAGTAVTAATQTVKVAFLQLQLGTQVPSINNNTAITAISADAVTADGAGDTGVPLTLAVSGTGTATSPVSGGHTLKLLLAAPEYNAAGTALAAPTGPAVADSVAGFRIGGALTTYAPWVAGDLGVNAVFTIAGRNLADYADLEGDYTALTPAVRWFTE